MIPDSELQAHVALGQAHGLTPRIRLLKVLVQPFFVVDHGMHLEELTQPAIAIPASDWPTYSGERFPRELAEWQARIDEGEDPLDGTARVV